MRAWWRCEICGAGKTPATDRRAAGAAFYRHYLSHHLGDSDA
jgi:hypothetical protein